MEGISYLLILGITMPLKYLFEEGLPNKIIGYAHGILFILYIYYAFKSRPIFKWDIKTFGFILLASVIPFATFYVDKKYLRT